MRSFQQRSLARTEAQGIHRSEGASYGRGEHVTERHNVLGQATPGSKLPATDGRQCPRPSPIDRPPTGKSVGKAGTLAGTILGAWAPWPTGSWLAG